MGDWPKEATWDDLIKTVLHREGTDPDAYDAAVHEIYARVPRATDYHRVIRERFEAGGRLGTRPDWEPSGLDAPKQGTWTVRVLSNDGYYPDTPTMLDDCWGLLAADSEVVWTAVHWPGEHPDDRAPLSWLTANEVQVYAAVSLAERHPRRYGRPRLYARSSHMYLHLDEPATSEQLFAESRKMAKRLDEESRHHGLTLQSAPCPQTFEADYNESATEIAEVIEAYEADHGLLIRGLYKFLVATDLLRFHHHLEEAAISAFISREAALELLRRKISAETGKRARREDIIARIRDEFPTGKPLVEVLESDWEARVIMVHPVSEHGEFWSPPVEVEECYDAVNTLIYLYRYLLLDEVWEPERGD